MECISFTTRCKAFHTFHPKEGLGDKLLKESDSSPVFQGETDLQAFSHKAICSSHTAPEGLDDVGLRGVERHDGDLAVARVVAADPEVLHATQPILARQQDRDGALDLWTEGAPLVQPRSRERALCL